MAFAAIVCGGLALADLGSHLEARGAEITHVGAPASTLLAQGHDLFRSSCSACHGIDAQGITGRGPSLHGVGALAADFYLETGRMPLASSRAQPMRTSPAFSQSKIRALIAYVASFGGPSIPTVAVRQGSLAKGHTLFSLDCAGCHTIQGGGGIVTGAVVPSLGVATPTQIAEAIRIGPYVMPRFGAGELSTADVALDRTLRAEHAAPRRSRRLGDREDRPDPGGHGRVAARDRRAGAGRAADRRAHRRSAADSLGRRRAHVSDPARESNRHSLAKRIWQALLMLSLWRLGALRRRRPTTEPRAHDPSRRDTGAPLWAERLVVMLLGLVPIAGLGFLALFMLDPDTQLLGLSLATALALLASALIVAGRHLVPQETKVERRPRPGDPTAVAEVASQARAGLDGITRRRLLAGAAGVAGTGLAAAVAIPVVALGPGIEEQLSRTPWYAGRELVDEEGNAILAENVNEGSFLTAFPRGADQDDLGSPLVLVRVDPGTLRLPAERASWAPQGILAYSKICTHAACAISLFRSPLSPSTESRGPALVCPCHYSTFDVLDGGSVEFGPAGRALPQLPLQIDASGALRAGGHMSGPVGPSWWGDSE